MLYIQYVHIQQLYSLYLPYALSIHYKIKFSDTYSYTNILPNCAVIDQMFILMISQ